MGSSAAQSPNPNKPNPNKPNPNKPNPNKPNPNKPNPSQVIVNGSKTVVWNGPAGVFEFDNFGKGTKALLTAVAETTANGNRGIIGGGDSATAAAKYGMEDKVRLVSTARPA